MARKKLNKNLVAFLTILGMVLSVAVVGVATWQVTRRDAHVWAEKAEQAVAAGDREQAILLYQKAYRVQSDVQYLLKAADCAFDVGEIGQSVQLIELARTQEPRNRDVLLKGLERYWQLSDYGYRVPDKLREYSDALLATDPDDVLALLSRAVALEDLASQDPGNRRRAEEAMQRAVELDASNPRVALTLARRKLGAAAQLAADAAAGTQLTDKSAEMAQLRDEAIQILRAGLEANPNEPKMLDQLSLVLANKGELDEAQRLLDAGVQANPDHAMLHLAFGRLLVHRINEGRRANARVAQLDRQIAEADQRGDALRAGDLQKQREQVTPHTVSEEDLAGFAQRAGQEVQAAIRIEPALYEGYIKLAQLELLKATPDSQGASADRYTAALAIYENALQETVGLKSIAAVVGEAGRAQMLYEAFDVSMAYLHDAESDAERVQALRFADHFLNESTTRYPEAASTLYMQGVNFLAREDKRAAMQAFRRTEDRVRTSPDPRFKLLATEQLAMLCRDAGEDGAAMDYTNRAIELYQESGGAVPLRLWLNKGLVLNQLQQWQELLDLTGQMQREYPQAAGEADVIKLRAAALSGLGRTEEANQLLAGTASINESEREMMRARIALFEKDYPTAEQVLSGILQSQPENMEAIRLYTSLMIAADKRDEGLRFIGQLRANATDRGMQRLLDSYEIVLGVRDPQERDRKLLEVIQTIEDPKVRSSELFNFYNTREQYEQAAPHLAELEKVFPEEPSIWEQQFILALNTKDCAKAERYVVKLAQANVDFANGAVFRGQLALSCGSVDQAVNEFRAAELALPHDPQVKIRLASALMQLPSPQYAEAADKLQGALAQEPRNFSAHKLLFVAYSAMGQEEQGLSHLTEAYKLNPSDPFVRERSEYIEENEDPAAAIAKREKIRTEKPEDVPNLIRLAQLYGHSKVRNTAKADECYAAAVKLDPTSTDLAQAIVRFYPGSGLPGRGEQLLRDCIAAREGESQVQGYILLATYFEQTGEQAAARDAYVQADELVEQVIGDPTERRKLRMTTAFLLADFYERTELIKEMIEVCRRILDRLDVAKVEDRDLIQRAELKIIQGMLRTRRYGEAEQELAKFTTDFPSNPFGMMLKAQLLLVRNNPAEARRMLNLALQQVPNNAWALFTRGNINYDLKNYDLALQDLLKVKQLAPTGFELRHRLRIASIYEQLGKPELAETEYDELLELRKGDVEIGTRLLMMFQRAGKMQKAKDVASKYMAQDPANYFWPRQLGEMAMQSEDYQLAARHFQTAVEKLPPENIVRPAVVADWMLASIRAGRPGDVTAALARMGDSVPPVNRAVAARAFWTQGDAERAAREFERAALEASLRSMGELFAVAGHMAETMPARDVAVRLQRLQEASDPGVDARNRLRCQIANELLRAGAPQEALSVIEPVLSEALDGSPELRAALLARGQCLHALKDAEGTVQAYEQVLLADPEDLQALNNLAYALAEDFDRPKEALKYAEQAALLAGENPHVLDTIGWVYFKNGKLQEAEQYLQSAVHAQSGYVAANMHLGQVYAALGQSAEARNWLQKALKLARDQKDPEKAGAVQRLLDSL